MHDNRRSSLTRRLPVALLALAVAAVTHVTVTAAEPAAPTAAEPPPAALAPRPLAASPALPAGAQRSGREWRAVARANLQVLRRPRSLTADTIAPAVARQPVLAGGGVDLAAARSVATSDGERAWIAPSSDGSSVCAVRSGAVACSATALLELTGLSPGINGRSGEPYHVWGTAGDDVRSLVLTEGDGTRVPVTVTDNFFDVATDDWPRSLAWTGPGGAESFVFPADYTG